MNDQLDHTPHVQKNKLLRISLFSIIAIFFLVISFNLTYNQTKFTYKNKAAEPTTPNMGNAAIFSHTDRSYININKSHTLGKFSNLTIEALVNYTEKSGATGIFDGYPIVSKRFRGGATNDAFSYLLEITSDKKVKFTYTIPFQGRFAPTEIISNTTVNPAIWNHIAVVYNNVWQSVDYGTIALYINGNRDVVIRQEGEICGGSETIIGDDVLIGTDPSATYFFNGYIDEVLISNTPRYIGQYFEPPVPFNFHSDSLALLHFNESSGNPAVESNIAGLSTTAYNITFSLNPLKPAAFTAATITVAPTMPPLPTNPGKALLLDGKSYINFQDIEKKLVITPNFTLEAWINPVPYTGVSGDSSSRTIISRYTNESNNYDYFWLFTNVYRNRESLDMMDFRYSLGKTGQLKSKIVPAGNWVHMALTRDGQKIRAYINGQLSEEATLTSTNNVPNDARDYFILGGWNAYGQLSSGYKGLIDDLRISNITRDVTGQWNKGTYFNPLQNDANTLGIWHFEDSINDESDNKLIGTVFGSIAYALGRVTAPAPPTPTPTPTPSYARCGGTTQPGKYSICGYVFYDANGNGIRDASETDGFPQISVQLNTGKNIKSAYPATFNDWKNTGKYVGKRMTGAGWYEFTNLSPGSYNIKNTTNPLPANSYVITTLLNQKKVITNRDIRSVDIGWKLKPTLTPTPTPRLKSQHTVCKNYICTVVVGAGTNMCQTNVDCKK